MSQSLQCPLCLGSKTKFFQLIDESRFHRCLNCYAVFTEQQSPSPKAEIFAEYEQSFSARYQTFDAWLQSTEKMLAGRGRLLNLGGSLGHCGKVAQDRGWETYVMDTSLGSVLRAKEKFGLKTFFSPKMSCIPVKDSSFDCVAAYGVIEKAEKPLEMLKEIHRTLQPTGILHLTTLNIHSISARLMRKKWYHFRPGTNFIYLSPPNLKAVLQAAGFEVLALKPLSASMRVCDVLKKIRKYWPQAIDKVERLVVRLNLQEKIISVRSGQMQVWARPKFTGLSPVGDSYSLDYAGTFHCPECRREIQLASEEASCKSCHSKYSLIHGILDFSKKPAVQESKQEVS